MLYGPNINPWAGAFLEKLIVAELVKNPLPITTPELY
jgi:hypothetical protein